jgi:hypothetical protein
LKKIKHDIVEGDEISFRNAARSLADYARVALNELGTYAPGYSVVSRQQIINRFDLLSPRIPELAVHKKLFKSIDDLRQSVDHDEGITPDKAQLTQLLTQVEQFNVLLEDELVVKTSVETLYRCEIKWDGQSQDTNDPVETKKVLDKAAIWVDNARNMTISKIDTITMQGQGPASLLNVKEGEVMFSHPKIAGRTPVSADIMVESNSPGAIDKILAGKEQWHWDIRWNIPQRMDLNKIEKRIKELTGRTPSGTSTDGRTMMSVSYHLFSDSEISMEVGIATYQNGMLYVYVGCYGSLLRGFVVASRVFSPGLILSALYGEISISEFRKKVNEGRGLESK